MPPLTCDDTESSDRSPICHTLVHPVYLRIHGLTCGNAELTHLEAVAIFRFAPSSRSGRRERAGRAAGTSKGEPDARDQGGSARIREGPRPSENAARSDPMGPAGTPKGEPGGGSAGDGTPRGDPESANDGGAPRGEPPSAVRQPREDAEVAWGNRAREAEGGWELRFPASRRSLGFSLFLLLPPTPRPPRSAGGLFSASVPAP
jgi:hypothetical protein